MSDERSLYRGRCDPRELQQKALLWRVLCHHFLQRYVGDDDRVLDLGAGYCEFVNAIRCTTKYALDVNDDVHVHAAHDYGCWCHPESASPSTFGVVDRVFASNFFEHLPDKAP